MAKETYPAGKRAKKPAVAPARPRGNAPNDNLTGSLKEWEESVFRYANHFTVFRFLRRRRGEVARDSTVYATFPEAVADAKKDERALVYAVTIEGRAVCLPRKEWPKYQAIWGERSP